MRILALIITLFFSVSLFAATSQTNSITLYASPDQTSKPVATIPAGQALVPIIQQKDWIKVGDPRTGNVGWMQQQALTQKAASITWQTPLVNQYVITEKDKDGADSKVYRVINFSSGGPSITFDPDQVQAYMAQMQAQQRAIQANFNKSMTDLMASFNAPIIVSPPMISHTAPTLAVQCQTLDCVRVGIDHIDTQIVTLVGQRLAYVKRAGEIKGKTQPVHDAAREAQIIAKVGQLAQQQGYPPAIVQAVYKVFLQQTSEYEKQFVH